MGWWTLREEQVTFFDSVFSVHDLSFVLAFAMRKLVKEPPHDPAPVVDASHQASHVVEWLEWPQSLLSPARWRVILHDDGQLATSWMRPLDPVGWLKA